MSKAYSIFLTVLFSLFLGGILVANLITRDRTFSPLENRNLQQAPKFTWEAVEDGAFMADAEKYINDQFVGRDFWVAAKAWGERLSGKRENNGIYFGSRETLLNRLEQPGWAELEEKMGYVDALVTNVSVPVYFGLIPSSSAIWSDRLPAGAPTADEKEIIDRLYFQTGAATVDLYGALSQHGEEDIYYRTDHHWTSLGAYYGYAAIMEAMGREPVALEDYEKETVTRDFNGTLFSNSGVRWLTPDEIDVYVPAGGVQVTSYVNAAPTEGALYVPEKLEQKDKYAFFLGGNQPLCVIRTDQTDAPRLLVLRDSYADSLAPWLTESFSEIHLFDVRYNMTSIRDYVAENQIDQVLVLYSMDDFFSNTYLWLLAR